MSKVLFASALFLIVACGEPPKASEPPEPSAPAEPTDIGPPVECPVCGLKFSRTEAVASFTHKGQTYYFLLKDHQEAFSRSPKTYLKQPLPEESSE